MRATTTMPCMPTADTDPSNPGGFVLHVAIADVAHYVRPGSQLDHEARLRGNSAYFPDRVVPMLPERFPMICAPAGAPGTPRVAAVRIVVDAQGNKRRRWLPTRPHALGRQLTYEEAQAAIDGRPNGTCRPLLEACSDHYGRPMLPWRLPATAANLCFSICRSARCSSMDTAG